VAGDLDETVLRHGQDLTRHAESLQASWQISGQILTGYGGVALVELCLTLFWLRVDVQYINQLPKEMQRVSGWP
jgi:hypothetical protein